MTDLLTPRQQEVAKLVAEGLTDKQIAGRLQSEDGKPLSPKTVSVHVVAIAYSLGIMGGNVRVKIATWWRDLSNSEAA